MAGKENVTPITPLASAFGMMQHNSPVSASFAARLKTYSEQYESTAEYRQKILSQLEPNTAAPQSPTKVLSPTKKAQLLSPTKRNSPTKKTTPHKSPKGRAGLKHKRIKNLMQEVQSVKDFSKLQEEVNENREKISSLHTRLTTVQKEKDSISSQLQIIEDIKRHLTEQLDEKNKQLEEVQTDSRVLNDKLANTERALDQSLSDLEKMKNEKNDQSIKRAKTEIVSELKTKNYSQEMQLMTQQLQELKEENAKALAYLELANREKEKAKEQEQTISTLQQNCDESTQKYNSLKRDFFISTCLAIKLNLSRMDRPVNVHVEDLWEIAEEQNIAIEQYPRFITAEIRKRYDASRK